MSLTGTTALLHQTPGNLNCLYNQAQSAVDSNDQKPHLFSFPPQQSHIGRILFCITYYNPYTTLVEGPVLFSFLISPSREQYIKKMGISEGDFVFL